jgi:hypothetical protein
LCAFLLGALYWAVKCFSGRGLVVGNYMPFWGVGVGSYVPFKKGVGGRQICAILLVGWW